MANVTDMIGGKFPPLHAQLLGFDQVEGITAAGTTTADATQLTGSFNVVGTTASSTGVKLPAITASPQNTIFVLNKGANTLSVYSASTINGTAGSTAYSINTTAGAMFTKNLAASGWWAVLLDT
jgi:hypothetical protein